MKRNLSQPATPARAWMSQAPDTSQPASIALRPPVVDEETDAVLGQAVVSLGMARGLEWVGDDGVVVHLLVSLIAQAQTRLDEAVAGALDQEYTWAEIGHLLGTTEADARKRFVRRT